MKSQIYTRRGDHGETSLADNTRVPKDSPRVEAYGTVDEANSWIGAARACAESKDTWLDGLLEFMQHRFFNCSSNLATPPGAGFEPPRITEADIEFLERSIDKMEEKTGALQHFVLPGGTACAAFLHVARTVCRRAERALVSLSRDEPIDPLVRKFINRSSDVLFAAARYANTIQGKNDIFWDKELRIP